MKLRALLTEGQEFVRIAELVPGRGPFQETDASKVEAFARDLADGGLCHAFSITDNAGGAPKVSPEAIGHSLQELGREVIVHLSAKDANRNGIESRVWMLSSLGLTNILCLSGDYPTAGYRGESNPVFDLDSVSLLAMLSEMSHGMKVEAPRKGEPPTITPAGLFLGAAVSPFKQQERELIPQYYKLEKKIAAGAEFIITQLGYDSRKFDEVLRYMEMKGVAVPLIANIYLLTGFVARHFHKGNTPGAVVSDALLEVAERAVKSPDKGKKFFKEFAAKQIAVCKGLGYRGVYLSGPRNAAEYQEIFKLAEEMEGSWKEFAKEIRYHQSREFYLFEEDRETGLSSKQINKEYLASLTGWGRGKLRSQLDASYRISRFVHSHLFDRNSRGFSLAKGVYEKVEATEGLKQLLHVGEQAAKIPMYGCKDCGDCSLPDIAYLCPGSQCAKQQRNGPCGGSYQGKCEIQEKDCIWARAYDRMKAYGEEEGIKAHPVVFRDGKLKGTSSWANAFLDRDHNSTTQG